MGSPRILVDTSVIIDYLRKKNKEKSDFYAMIKKYSVCISSITEFELFAGATDEQKKADILSIIKFCETFSFSSETARISARIYNNLKSNNQLIDMRDIFIAATAEAYNCPLATQNEKHFKRIKSITLI